MNMVLYQQEEEHYPYDIKLDNAYYKIITPIFNKQLLYYVYIHNINSIIIKKMTRAMLMPLFYSLLSVTLFYFLNKVLNDKKAA